MMKELGRGAMPPRIFGLEPVNNIGQLPCASASVLRYTASVLASVSASTALVTTLGSLRQRRVRLSGRLDVCLDICHTPVLCLAERKQDREITLSDSPMTLDSGEVWFIEKFARGHPKGTCQMREGWVFSAIFDQYVVISRKRCILDTKLLWGGNRKPYASYRMASLSMTLSDPLPGFQGHGSFKRRVSPKRRILQTQLLCGTLIGNHRQAIDRQASYTAYNNPSALT